MNKEVWYRDNTQPWYVVWSMPVGLFVGLMVLMALTGGV